MEQTDEIIACMITVQRTTAYNPATPYILCGTLIAVVLVIALAVVLYHWADVRDAERDKEIGALRKLAKASGACPAGVL